MWDETVEDSPARYRLIRREEERAGNKPIRNICGMKHKTGNFHPPTCRKQK
jgi:hypothetical protein